MTAERTTRIEQGRTYTLTATGWRVPILSAFPNIIEATEEQA